MADKRGARRRIKRLSVTFLCGTEEYRGITSNLSDRGLFIRTRKSLKPGLSVAMVLDVNETQKIALKGVVARELNRVYRGSNNGIGVELTEIPQAYKDLLREICEKDV